MLEKKEDQLVDLVTKTHSYYKLIGQASQSQNIHTFFEDIGKMKDTFKLEVMRRMKIKEYFQGTS